MKPSNHEKRWRNLKDLLLSKRSQSEKTTYWMIPTLCFSQLSITVTKIPEENQPKDLFWLMVLGVFSPQSLGSINSGPW
jgi:hypothetical protein